MQGEAAGAGLAQLQARRHWGIPCRYLPQPKRVPEMLGPDPAPRGTVRAPEALAQAAAWDDVEETALLVRVGCPWN